MSQQDRVRAALVPVMGAFLNDLPLMGVAEFGPLPMDDWTEDDHIAAVRWVGAGAVGAPPFRVAQYIRALRKSCEAPPAEWLTEPVDSPFRVIAPGQTGADIFGVLDLKPAPSTVRVAWMQDFGLWPESEDLEGLDLLDPGTTDPEELRERLAAYFASRGPMPGTVAHLEAICKRHDPSAELTEGIGSVDVVTSLDEEGAADLRAELDLARCVGVLLTVTRRAKESP